jgi:hypothetical protein
MSEQQTVLRVKTSIPSTLEVTGTTSITVTGNTTGFTYSGTTGLPGDPFKGKYPDNVSAFLTVNVTGDGTLKFDFKLYSVAIGQNFLQVFIQHPDEPFQRKVMNTFPPSNTNYSDEFKVKDGDIVIFKQGGAPVTGSDYSIFIEPDNDYLVQTIDTFEYLDIYEDIPIKINKSFAELQDIGKKNSDYSVGLKLPGTKKNNRFFENFYNVDNVSLFFNVTRKVECAVLINDESFFNGYLKLNSINVQNSKVEYDVVLLSTVADLYAAIGNDLLNDLDFRDPDYFFNHIFNKNNCLQGWRYETLKSTNVIPSTYFYPVAHNGYVYTTSGDTQVVQTGSTSGTSLYTTTKLGSWANAATAYSNGVTRGNINSPEDGVRDNQLKPALNVYALINLIFKQKGYKIKSDFFSTPWFKLLYLYGYFSDNSPKLTYQTPNNLPVFNSSQVDLVFTLRNSTSVIFYVVKQGTGTPCLCDVPITGTVFVRNPFAPTFEFPANFTIPANTASYGVSWTAPNTWSRATSPVGVTNKTLNYLPTQTGTTVDIVDGEYLNFSQIIDENIKQIDFVSAIAKKFNLVLIPNKDNPTEIIIEPYEYYIGSGQIYDWTDKLSYDKGFTVQPAQNFIESELHLTDKEDGDAGNVEFKQTNNRIYGRNIQYNPTQFKSSEKKIETIFSPQLLRKWNPDTPPLSGVTNDVGIPLMINYSESSQENDKVVNWTYSGVKTNPRLIFNMGNFSPFLDQPKETFNLTGVTTSYFRITENDGTNSEGSLISPVVTHTMPMGNPDKNKKNNDSISILFNSERQVNIQGKSVQVLGSGSTLNIYTEQNVYKLFYDRRVKNAYNENTRMVSGYFNLSIRDIDKLEAKDLIKINDQYFTWNKIENYNLTSPELTKVELVQLNFEVSQYPERYFKYQYCSGDTTTYKFKTNFTGQTSVYDTFYYWSIVYDYFVGFLGGNGVTGYTSSIPYTGNTYIPYSIYEVTESDYNASGTLYTGDPQSTYFIESTEEAPVGTIYNQKNPVWLINSGQTKATLNVFTGCTDFNTTASSIGVRVLGSATGSTNSTGITINVTDTGWIKYTKSNGDTQYRQITSLGNYDIPDCADCITIIPGFPYADVASFTIVDCGNPC